MNRPAGWAFLQEPDQLFSFSLLFFPPQASHSPPSVPLTASLFFSSVLKHLRTLSRFHHGVDDRQDRSTNVWSRLRPSAQQDLDVIAIWSIVSNRRICARFFSH